MTADPLLSGNLNFFSLPDLLQMLGGNGASGILRLHSPHSPHPGLIYFHDGQPIHALNGDKLGLEALYSLFGWLTGEFSFSPENFNVARTIHHSRMQLILDGLKMLDDGEVSVLGPPDPARQARHLDFNLVHGPLVDYMAVVDEERYVAGQQIMVEGAYGSWIWVILEGQVELLRETPDGPLKLLSLGEGAFIGNMTSFSIHGHIRRASCVAATDVVLGVLDLQRLSVEYTRMSPEMRAVALSLDRRLTQAMDRLVMCRREEIDLDPGVEELAPVEAAANDSGIYAITEGQAAVLWQKASKPFMLARLGTNDVFGRIPFADIGHEPHSAVVLGDGALAFRPLDQVALDAEYRALSSTFRNFFKSMINALVVTTRLAAQAHARSVHTGIDHRHQPRALKPLTT
jgi:CRP-like cAMP-binding protein